MAMFKENRSKEQAFCIFCDGAKLTKQHIWADWLRKVVRIDSESHMQNMTRLSIVGQEALIAPELNAKRGDLYSRKIRKVCGRCNSGWLSDIETRVQSILTDLILGSGPITTLTPTQQINLAAWITNVTIMGEFLDLPTLAIPKSDYEVFYARHLPPDHWRILISRYAGAEWIKRYRHSGFALGVGPWFGASRPPNNAQSTTFTVGELFVQVLSSNLPTFDRIIQTFDHTDLILIWPHLGAPAEWPNSPKIGDPEAMEISNWMYGKALQKEWAR